MMVDKYDQNSEILFNEAVERNKNQVATNEDIFLLRKSGYKLEPDDYRNLTTSHYKYHIKKVFLDFSELKAYIESRYPNLNQAIPVYEECYEEFIQYALDFDENDPVENSMIDDWNYGKKCESEIRRLKANLRFSNETKKIVDKARSTLQSDLSDHQLVKVKVLIIDEGVIKQLTDQCFLFWFGRTDIESPKHIKLEPHQSTTFATIMQKICTEGSDRIPAIKIALNDPNFSTKPKSNSIVFDFEKKLNVIINSK